MSSRAFLRKSQFCSIFEIPLEFNPSQSEAVINFNRQYLDLLGKKLVVIMFRYDFIVKKLKPGFRYISLKRDELDFVRNGLKTFLYEFFSVGESLFQFAKPSQNL